MARNPIVAVTTRAYLAFDFLTPENRASFALTAVKFGLAFTLGYLVQLSGVLSPDIARGNEVLAALLIVLFLPMVAALCRRLTDARMPLLLSIAPLLLWGAASASTVMFGWPLGTTILQWAAIASAVALVVALCLPTAHRHSTGGMQS